MVRQNNKSIITILRRYSKVITAFLVVNFLTSLVYPMVSFALTAGPTAPEYTSFEPFDTSTMVNKLTGDMVYNIPLLEVPGPAGGYPLSLSYHAGIEPQVEASWVGLGWTLNPGSITRLVNGYADDHNAVTGVVRDFWEGGYTEEYTLGLSVGIANMPLASAELVFAHDTYQGFGFGQALNAGSTFYRFSAGKRPHGGLYSDLDPGLYLSYNTSDDASGANQSSATIGNGSFSGKAVYNSKSNSLGISISSNQRRDGEIVQGLMQKLDVSNANAGNIDTENVGLNFKVDIPIASGINLRLGRKKERYFSDETASVETYGNLYNQNPSQADETFYDERAEDVQDIPNPLSSLSPNYNPLKDMNGTLAATDYYSVTGQGIGGNMKPYQFTSYLNRQNKKLSNGDYLNKNYHFANSTAESMPHFRFIGDFSNRLEYDMPSFLHSQGDLSSGLNNDFQTGNEEDNGFVNEQLIGSRHIEFMTNQDFVNGDHHTSTFLETNSSGFDRNSTPGDQIGGFVITNESGIKYHYSLPVYTYDEHVYTENLDQSGGRSFNHLRNDEPYAYTWLLTAVTGPDFVDRGGTANAPNGVLDENDWGYWVEFDYGMTTDAYKWRNPAQGFNRDLDNGFQTFSIGKKQIYYLDAVKTKTHSALFFKDVRLDGKGVTTNGPIVSTPGGNVVVDDGGFEAEDLGDGSYDVPIPSLKLNKVILVQNQDVPQVDKSLSNSQPISSTVPQLSWDNTLDIYDEIISNLGSNAIRTINLETDYELQQGTPNSFENNFYADADPTIFFDDYVKNGKLTLKGVEFAGKGGNSLIPPLEFAYAKNPNFDEHAIDLWGFYKSDYTGNGDLNENLSRMTTVNSSNDVDAWSLSNIANSLGATVEIVYESDDYSKSELVTNKAFIIEDVAEYGSNELTLTLETFGLNLDDIFSVGQTSYPALTYTTFVNFSVCTDNDFIDYTGLNIDPSEITHIDPSSNTLRIRKPVVVALPDIDPPAGCESYSTSIQFTGGNLSYFSDSRTYGGGLRVRSISLNSSTSEEKSTTYYEYTKPSSSVSSGVTSYEPVTFDLIDPGLHADAQFSLRQHLYAGFSDLLQKSSEVPGPGVLYEYVTIKESVTKEGVETFVPGYSTYQFQTFDEAMVDFEHFDNQQTTFESRRLTSQNVKIHSLLSNVGNLKSVSLYDLQGKKISESINHYLIDDLLDNSNVQSSYLTALDKFDKQGVLAETFANARIVINENGSIDEDLVGVMTQRITYPSIQVGQSRRNFITGYRNESKTLKFDFFSGQVLDAYNHDKYGNKYVSKNIPAYRLNNGSAYPEMGPISESATNKNMLTQMGVSFSFKVTDTYDPETHILDGSIAGLVDGQVNTWEDGASALYFDGNYSSSSDQDGIYRRKSSYNFIGNTVPQSDGTYGVNSYEELLNSVNLISNQPDLDFGWQKNNEITKYDVFAHALEASDINGNFAATKMDLQQERVLSTVANAKYSEFAFSGAEDGDGEGAGTNNFGGGVLQPEGQRVHVFGADGLEGTSDDKKSHTGFWSIEIADNVAFEYSDDLKRGKSYRALVWSSLKNGVKFQVSVNGSGIGDVPTHEIGSSNGWHLHEAIIQVADGATELTNVDIYVRGVGTNPKYIDDFRFHPVDASMTAYVYNEWGELSHVLDQNNLYTHYKYDAIGRLKSITRETFKHGPVKVSETIINYARSNN